MEVEKKHLECRRWLVVGSLLAALACARSAQAQTPSAPITINNGGNYTITTNFDNGGLDVYVGSNVSHNSLTIQAVLSDVGAGYIGWASANNTVTVTGGSAQWTINGALWVGFTGAFNNLTIANGGQVTHGGSAIIGNDLRSSNNTVWVTGTNSLLNNGGGIFLGNDSSGNGLIISNSAQVVDGNDDVIGSTLTGNANNNWALVTGGGSVWNISGDLYAGGSSSSNNLTIANGGLVVNNNGYIGYDGSLGSGMGNSVVVTGSGSIWSNNSDLILGCLNGASGNSLVITNGGQVFNGFSAYGAVIGFDNIMGLANNNTVLVTGSGSRWNDGSDLYVGYYSSSNNLTIASGGVVTNGNGYIGYDGTFGGMGNSVVVTGAGSIWSNTSDVILGYQNGASSNSLVIANGGKVFNGNSNSTYGAVIGFDNITGVANNNTVLVTGSGSVWNNSSDLYVGYYSSSNNLTVANGGVVVNGNGYIGYDGSLGGGMSNSVMVTDSGSIWSNTGDVILGYQNGAVGNSLVIANGGQVLNNNGYIGYDAASSNNSALVSGPGSLWSNSGSLFVGYGGAGSLLTLTNGGVVWATNIVVGASDSSTGNVVTISGGSLYATNGGGGALNVLYGTLNMNSGTAAVDWLLLTNFANSVFNFNGGVLRAGQMLSTQPITVNGGTLSLAGSFVNSTGATFLLNSGSVIVPGSMANRGLFIQNGGLFDPLVFTNSGSFVLNNGTNMDGVFLNLASGVVQQSGGEHDVNVATNYGSWAISGGVANLTNLVIDGGGVFTNAGGMLVSTNAFGTGGMDVRNGVLVLNSGMVTVNQFFATNLTSSVISFNGGTLNSGGTIISNGTQFVVGNGSSAATMNLVGGTNVFASGLTIAANATLSNAATLTAPSVTINAAGQFAMNGGLAAANFVTNFGSWAISGGVANLTNFISDNHSSLTVSGGVLNGTLTIGNTGSFNQLVVTNGGAIISAGTNYIGNSSTSSNNSVLMTGAGSVWSNSSLLVFGNNGAGNRLTIANGGQISDSNTVVGIASGSINNSILVTGNGSVWTNTGYLTLGYSGAGNNLTISNGGQVFTGPSGGYIGKASTNNSVIVTDPGSLWNTVGSIYVGQGGSYNNLTIANGGQVLSGAADLIDWGSSVLVTGPGSLWQTPTVNIGQWYVSGNLLTVSNGGSVVSTSMVAGASPFSMNNVIVVSGGNLYATNTSKTGSLDLRFGTLMLNSGTVTVNRFYATNGANSIVSFNGGTLNSGGTVISNGTQFVVGNGSSAATMNLVGGTNVFANGLTIAANGTMTNAATLRTPGLLINATGRFAMNAGLAVVNVVTNGGTFIQSGGLFDPAFYDNTGTFSLLSGTNMDTVFLNEASGTVNQSGGEHDVNVATNFGAWTVSGGVANLTNFNDLGTLILSGGVMNVSALVVTNTGSVLTFNGGTLNSDGTLINNGAAFTVGDTGGGAALNLLGGAHSFSNGLVVGNSGIGNGLLITNGARAFVDGSTSFTTNGILYGGTTVLGYAASSSNNTMLVSGAGSIFSNRVNMIVGLYGSGNSLTIANSGQVFGGGFVGFGGSASNNTVLVTGAGSVWNSLGALYVGNLGSSGNSLTIANGGHVFDTLGYFGAGYGNAGNNTVTVNGAGSLWNNSGDLYAGMGDSGNLLAITNGGRVVNTNGLIGANANNNTVAVTGSGSVWSNSGVLYVGNFGSSNSLAIAGGGVVYDTTGFIGSNAGANGNAVTVTSPGSLWSNSGQLYVGYSGSFNQLTIANGGQMKNATGYVGSTFGANTNSVLVTGTGSVWNNSSWLYVGNTGSFNQLTIANGGTVLNTFGFIGYDSNANNNAVLVTGAGSVWSNSGNLMVGRDGTGNQLTITNGGVVITAGSYVGYFANSNKALVSGAGSVWNNSSFLEVGGSGSDNQLTIANGGAVFSTSGFIGWLATNGANSNTVLVTDAGSVWSNSGNIYVGWNQAFNNQLTITNGGAVFSSNGFIGLGYTNSANSNAVVVTGASSIWNNSACLYVGDTGSFNQLTITNGGTVFNTTGYVGYASGANSNAVLVTGAGSIWNNSGSFYVGYSGSNNSLTIANGGAVTATNVVIGNSASTGNVLTVSGGWLYATNITASGALNVNYGTLNLLSGTVTVNQLIVSNGANSVLSFNGGTLNSGGSAVNNGSIFQVGNGSSAATFDLLGGAHSFASGLFINTNAILAGTGAITGSITDAGLIAPGNGFGVITDTGNLTMLGGGAMTMELGGTNAWLYDQFDLTGALTFGGTLTLTLLNGYTPQAGDQFNLFDFGSGSGAFSVTNLPTLSPNLYWNTSALYSMGVIEADQTAGSLQVTLAPQAAIDAGAKWQVDADGNWHTNNETVGGLLVGSHTVSYTNLTGWIAPTNQSVQIVSGVTTTNNGTYQLTPLLLAAVSRKTQGAGTFDLNLNLNGVPSATVEPRISGPTQLVFTFNKAMAAADGTLDVTEFTVTNATFVSASIVTSNLTLNLTSVVDQSKVTVVMNGLTDLAGNPLSGTNAVIVRSLYGDVNQSGTVNAVDLQQVKNNLLAALTPANFLCDVNSSGTINAVDLQQIKNNLLHSASLADSGAAQTFSSSDAGSSVTTSALATTTLGEALGAANLTWSTNGDAPWTATLAEDGSSAAMSGNIGDLNVSWVETTVTGPGTLSFDWMVSSELNGDYLTFAIDGVNQPGAISGEVNWQTLTFDIPAGTHRLTWTYSKNASTASGLDAGWVRRVVYPKTP